MPSKTVKMTCRVNQGVIVSGLPGDEFVEVTVVKVLGSKAHRRAKVLARSQKAFHTLEIGRKVVSLGFDVALRAGEAKTPRYLVQLVMPQVAGLLRRGQSQLYVSRGTGFWGPPIRLFAPSEITEIVIRRG